MNTNEKPQPEDLLKLFDKIISDNPFHIRTSARLICDYYKGLLLTVGTTYFECDRKLLKKYGLKTRWDYIKIRLKTIINCDEEDKIIYPLDTIRNEVEHNDDYIPKKSDLKNFREKLHDFQKWLISNSDDFFKKSKNISFKDQFYLEFEWAVREGEVLIEEFGNKSFISFEYEGLWDQLSVLLGQMNARLKTVNKLHELKKSDLENLLLATKIISKFRGREDMLLHLSRCPKCGSKIVETQTDFGGTIDDPEPDGTYYRVGCEKCDYYLDDDTIY